MDPVTISIILSAAIVGIISISTGRSLYKDIYNSRFNSWGYRITRYRPDETGYKPLYDIITSDTVADMSSAVAFIGGAKVSTNVIKCRVAGKPPTVRCRVGIQQDAVIYLIVWDPPVFRRKYGLRYYQKLLEDIDSGDGNTGAYSPLIDSRLIPIATSLLIKN